MTDANFYSINGKINVSVASNNITVSITDYDGSNFSAGNPMVYKIGDTPRVLSGALSVTKNAGTNWFNSGASELATKAVDYFVYLGYNATDGVTIGFARIPYANTYADFSATSTNEKYCAISTISNAAGTDFYVVIGRFTATLSATASFNWSISGTANVINRPIFETDTLYWTPTMTGWGASPPAGGIYSYKLRMNEVTYHINQANNATSTTTGVAFTLPWTSKTEATKNWTGVPGQITNNSAVPTTPSFSQLLNNSNVLNIYTDFAGGGWTASGNKRIAFARGTYEIA